MADKEREDSNNYISLRDHVDKICTTKDRLCDKLMMSLEERFDIRICAIEKSIKSAFESSEKAIEKAEMAQKEYNARSNEFRGQLDDQAKMLMPRNESIATTKANRDRTEDIWKMYEERHEIMRTDIEKLRDQVIQSRGAKEGHKESWTWLIGAVSLVVSVITLLMILTKIMKP